MRSEQGNPSERFIGRKKVWLEVEARNGLCGDDKDGVQSCDSELKGVGKRESRASSPANDLFVWQR